MAYFADISTRPAVRESWHPRRASTTKSLTASWSRDIHSPSVHTRQEGTAPIEQTSGLSVVGLFAGIGGIEEGLRRAGHHAVLFCEIEPAARSVLGARFPDTRLCNDIRTLRILPPVDLIAAGFPCTDLSQAGRARGIAGSESGLVSHVFRLVEQMKKRPTWLLLENVPFMLHLHRGRAMRLLTRQLEELGYAWAYRVVDTRAFGLPHRRKRVLILASRTEDARDVLLSRGEGERPEPNAAGDERPACGFYWTEGTKGLGWAIDAIPTLKGGSGLGIPSPPAIWMPDGSIGTPDIRDAERLQGFPVNWSTPAAENGSKRGARWRFVGNAVSVPVAHWVGRRLQRPSHASHQADQRIQPGDSWPQAAWGRDGTVWEARISGWPTRRRPPHLTDFLRYPATPLSARATSGFLGRLRASRLRFPAEFLHDLQAHLEHARSG